MSQLTTHILDTTKGKPAEGIRVILFKNHHAQWEEITSRNTNADGRIPDLLNRGVTLEYGLYQMRFETKEYFDKSNIPAFYPYIEIVFEISSKEHYHIPLLLSPFGYSTYRGS